MVPLEVRDCANTFGKRVLAFIFRFFLEILQSFDDILQEKFLIGLIEFMVWQFWGKKYMVDQVLQHLGR